MTQFTASLRRAFVTLLIAFAAVAASAPASHAEDPIGDFFGSLFGDGPSHRSRSDGEHSPRVRRIMPHRENRAPTYWRSGEGRAARKAARRVETPSEASPAISGEQAAAPTQTGPTFYVAVLGDTLGILLANGLQEGLAAEKPEIAILRNSKESSGLVRDDFYDWPKAARDIASGPQKIDVAVIMLGSNDRQTIKSGSESAEPMTDRFRQLYAARVDSVLNAFKEKRIPVVWVGLPVMKNEHFSADMAKLNEIYKERAAHAGAVYVDIWEAIADEKGQYSAFGPDINGQIVKLRSADGVHFTDAGARSVAHFVALEVKKLYDALRPAAPVSTGQPPSARSDAAAPAAASLAAPPPTSAAPGQPLVFRSPVSAPYVTAPVLPERPAVGPAQPLAAVSPASGEELARRAPAPVDPSQTLAKHVFVDGGDQTPRPNRADDYSWKR